MKEETRHIENLKLEESLIRVEETMTELRNLLHEAAVCNGLDDWVNQSLAQKITGLSKSTLYNLRQQGRITWSSFTGKEVFYRRSDLICYLDRRERKRA